jgi:hypothetical protein
MNAFLKLSFYQTLSLIYITLNAPQNVVRLTEYAEEESFLASRERSLLGPIPSAEIAVYDSTLNLATKPVPLRNLHTDMTNENTPHFAFQSPFSSPPSTIYISYF